MWKRLYHRLEVRQRKGYEIEVPSIAALDAFEEKFDFKLPKRYRAFVQLFGVGELLSYFHIAAPGYGRYAYDLATFNGKHAPHGDDSLSRRTGRPDVIRRLIYFSATIAGDWIGWDREALRDRRSREYAIIVIPYGGFDPLVQVAESFKGFVNDVCLTGKFNCLVYDLKQPEEFPQRYFPYRYKRIAPRKKR
jgi:hypothetical protein